MKLWIVKHQADTDETRPAVYFSKAEADAHAAQFLPGVARVVELDEDAQRDAARYRWLRQVAEGEASNGEHCPIINLYGLQGAAEAAFLNKAPHLTDAIDAAMKGQA